MALVGKASIVLLVLPFGLSSAPFIFTKTVQCILKYLRSLGVRTACFIDDGMISSNDYDIALQQSNFVQETLNKTGFVINNEKSVWVPCKKIKWIGFEINSEIGILYIPEDRTNSIHNCIENLLSKLPYTTARRLATLCGKIISTKLVLGHISQLKTRNLYSTIEQQVS